MQNYKPTRISVTAADIAEGERTFNTLGPELSCPIRRAITRVAGRQAYVSRGWGFLHEKGVSFTTRGGEFVLPTAARAFLRDFNTGKAVKPFTFDLRLDDGS